MKYVNTIEWLLFSLALLVTSSSRLVCSAFLHSPTSSITTRSFRKTNKLSSSTARNVILPIDSLQIGHLATSTSTAVASSLMGSPIMDMLKTVGTAYHTCLTEQPLITKSITAFTLCGAGDIIAQSRDPTRTTKIIDDESQNQITTAVNNPIDWKRCSRFAIKGAGGGLIWNAWYERADFISTAVLTSLIGLAPEEVTDFYRIITSMTIEQFLWAPVVFGIWEIPIATLMNGAGFTPIQSEVRTKLGGLLMANAKVWTPANIIIFSIPSEFRLGFSNLVDLIWQSLVADVAADCGMGDDNVEKGYEDETVMLSETSSLTTRSDSIASSYTEEPEELMEIPAIPMVPSGGNRIKAIIQQKESSELF